MNENQQLMEIQSNFAQRGPISFYFLGFFTSDIMRLTDINPSYYKVILHGPAKVLVITRFHCTWTWRWSTSGWHRLITSSSEHYPLPYPFEPVQVLSPIPPLLKITACSWRKTSSCNGDLSYLCPRGCVLQRLLYELEDAQQETDKHTTNQPNPTPPPSLNVLPHPCPVCDHHNN